MSMIRQALDVLFEPGAVVELRIPKAGKYRTIAGYFDDFDALANAALNRSGKVKAVYVTLNVLDPALLARSHNKIKPYTELTTTDAQVTARRWLLVDIDAMRPAGVSSSDAEHDAALTLALRVRDDLMSDGWPHPVYADSGNGAHLLYRIDEPSQDGDLIKNVLAGLAFRFNTPGLEIDTSVYNPARISKLYGTIACKGDDMPERPHRLAQIIEAPDAVQVVDHALLEAMVASVPQDEPQETRRLKSSVFNLEVWMAQHLPQATGPTPWANGGKRWILPECPWRAEDKRSAYVVQLPSGAIKAACQHATCPGSHASGNHWSELRSMYDLDRPVKRDAPKSQPYHLTDTGNGQRFVDEHVDEVRYCHSWGKWLVWDGKRWQQDSDAAMMRLATETVAMMYADMGQIHDRQERKKFFRFVMLSESDPRLRAMLALAESRIEVAITHRVLDCDPWKLNVLNGVLDLQTGDLSPHNPGDHITKLAPVRYDPEAQLDLWDSFLQESTDNDQDMIDFLARAVGYTLTGMTTEEKLFFVHGPTSTGKSTFLEAINAMLGDYAITADFETFLSRSFTGGPRPDVARLAGARFVASIEVDEGKKLAEGLVKQLTGGDTVTARFLYHDAFEFMPQFKLWLAANHAPAIKHDDTAMWRRILKVPFEEQVPEDRRSPSVKQTLSNIQIAGAAILNWALKGCLAWQRDGLGIPPCVKLATEEYRHEQDPLGEFITAYCVLSNNIWTPAGALREVYEKWLHETGTREVLNGKKWKAALESHGCTNKRKTVSGVTTRCWAGIGLVGDDPVYEQAGYLDDNIPF